jgi:2,4-dienoyl-CoA reductase-like NADH-dependent reductase (Old Yellow Enzyme family)
MAGESDIPRVRHRLLEPRWPSQDEARASRLFSPIKIGPKQLGARTWVPAMVPWRATDAGEVTPALLAWYERFARGKPGAIVVEATGIRDIPSGPLLRIGDDRFIPGLRQLVEVVKRASDGETKLFIQLIDFLSVKRRPEPKKYFERFLSITGDHRARLAALTGDAGWSNADDAAVRARLTIASDRELEQVLTARELEALRFGYRERVNDLHLPEIRALPKVLPTLFADAAIRAERAGFDGIELHYAHAYTMAGFLSRTNDRDDGYGGTAAGRLRLPLEVFIVVRQAVSPDLVVGCRYLGDEVIDGGSRVADAIEYGEGFAKVGMDFVSLSKGGKFEDAKPPKIGHAVYPYTGPSGHECMPTIYSDARGPIGRQLPIARAIRAAIRESGMTTPIVAAGGINGFDVAERALLDGDADIIAAARQSLADPDWWAKMREGRGHEIRRCALTNYCEGLDQQHKEVTCRLWDRDFDDGLVTLRSSDGKRRLVAP